MHLAPSLRTNLNFLSVSLFFLDIPVLISIDLIKLEREEDLGAVTWATLVW